MVPRRNGVPQKTGGFFGGWRSLLDGGGCLEMGRGGGETMFLFLFLFMLEVQRYLLYTVDLSSKT